MPQAIAITKFIRTSPRKLRLVADVVRGMEAEKALQQLKFINKRARGPIFKAIKQAVANAQQLGLSSPLKITQLLVDQGPVYKRWRAISRGQAHSIHKFTSHIKVVLESQKTAKIATTKVTDNSRAAVAKVTDRVRSVVTKKPKTNKAEPKPVITEGQKKAETPQRDNAPVSVKTTAANQKKAVLK